MNVLQINATYKLGSTGWIVANLKNKLDNLNITNEVICFKSGTKEKNVYVINRPILKKINSLVSHVFGNFGFEDFFNTRKVFRIIKKTKPSIVHIHNIHDHSINISKFIKFLNKNNIKIVWTFHDCWSFTGYCTHFELLACNKWKTCCSKCPQKKKYSFLFDRSRNNFLAKKELFNYDINIVVPSIWLANLVNKSPIFKKSLNIINNGIDLSVFKRINNAKINIGKKYNIPINNKILLSVSNKFSFEKGLSTIEFLAKSLPSNYTLILIGDSGKKLSPNVIQINKINNSHELAEFYSAADIFINPTLEDNYPTVNMEAIACGTPVITYNTGGSPESMKGFGTIVDKNNQNAFLNAVLNFEKSAIDAKLDLTSIDYKIKLSQYIELYKKIENE